MRYTSDSMSEGLQRDEQGGVGLFAMPRLTEALHEIKSPLASIRQMALMLSSGELSERDAALYARRIELTSERALRLASDVTRATRLEDALFCCEPVNPIAMCDEVVTQMDALYQARGRRLEVARRRQAPLAVANRELLGRILINFADNALHYAPGSGIVRLHVASSRDGGKIRIWVRDYGPGVAANIWQRVAGGGQRPVSRRPESSGLGLHLSKQFAEAMGASVGVTRHQDGASFYVELMGSTQTSLL